jgi:hypothetical protein
MIKIIDDITALYHSPNPQNSWKILKHRLVKEESELVTNCTQLKKQTTDGKFYNTDVADTEQLLRFIAENTRKEIEAKTRKKIISTKNAKEINDIKLIKKTKK